MMRTVSFFLLMLFILALQSCFKEDEIVIPHARGGVLTDTIPMTENYLYQNYFSLDSGKVVSVNVKTIYDLGFECSNTGWHVILNSSDFMKAADLGVVPFGQPYDTTGFKLQFDKSDGDPDSTAIGKWFTINGNDTISNNHVYAVSRGLDEYGNPLGLYQLIIDSLKNSTYYFRYAPLGGGPGFSGKVVKKSAVSYMYFSLKTGAEVSIEPPQQTYDLLFTQYTTLLFTSEGIPYPYLVTGVLLNRHAVIAAVDSSADFLSISRDMAITMTYSRNMDAIGYDWKFYNFTTGVYTIRPNLNYIIRSVSGFYYKLRFVAFYNEDGLKGYPMIEYQQL
jgi:hypothetical protein